MKFTHTTKFIGVSMLALGGLTGCPDEPEPKEPISHAAVHAQLQDNIKGSLGKLDGDLAFVESSMLGEAAGEVAGRDCAEIVPNGPDEPIEEFDCEPEPVDFRLAELGDQMVDMIDRVLTEEAIESATEDTIVYKLSADVLCEPATGAGGATAPQPSDNAGEGAPEGDAEADSEDEFPTPEGLEGVEFIDEEEDAEACRDMVSHLEPRIAVSNGAADILRLRLMVGSDRISPLTFEIGANGLAAEVDFAEGKRAVESISAAMDEELPPIPATFEGALRVALDTSLATKPSVALSITKAINIANEEGEDSVSLQMEAASPAAVLTLDSATKQMTALLSLGAVNLEANLREFAMDDAEPRAVVGPEGEFEEVDDIAPDSEPLKVAFAMPGFDLDAAFDMEKERIEVKTLSLGEGTTSLTINEENRIAVDLNPNDGRSLGFVVASMEEAEGALITLTNAVAELRVDVQTAPEGEEDNRPSWMDHEVFTVRLEGEGAAVATHEDGLAVNAGRLTLDAEYGEIRHEVEAGQCLAFPTHDDEPSFDVEDGEAPSEEVAEDGEVSHPFELLEVNACG